MNWVKILGWLNVCFLAVLILFYLSLLLNSKIFHNHSVSLKIVKILKKLHPAAGVLLMIGAAVHGYLALYGTFMLHTGTVLFFLLVLTIFFVVAGKTLGFKKWFFFHKLFAFLSVIGLIIHLLVPDLLSF